MLSSARLVVYLTYLEVCLMSPGGGALGTARSPVCLGTSEIHPSALGSFLPAVPPLLSFVWTVLTCGSRDSGGLRAGDREAFIIHTACT